MSGDMADSESTSNKDDTVATTTDATSFTNTDAPSNVVYNCCSNQLTLLQLLGGEATNCVATHPTTLATVRKTILAITSPYGVRILQGAAYLPIIWCGKLSPWLGDTSAAEAAISRTMRKLSAAGLLVRLDMTHPVCYRIGQFEERDASGGGFNSSAFYRRGVVYALPDKLRESVRRCFETNLLPLDEDLGKQITEQRGKWEERLNIMSSNGVIVQPPCVCCSERIYTQSPKIKRHHVCLSCAGHRYWEFLKTQPQQVHNS